MTANPWRSLATRWIKFNLVGAMGLVVQVLVAGCVEDRAATSITPVATALAVEAAGSPQFSVRTNASPWVDRTGAARFIKFNLTTGLFSIAGNLVLMKLLVGLGT